MTEIKEDKTNTAAGIREGISRKPDDKKIHQQLNEISDKKKINSDTVSKPLSTKLTQKPNNGFNQCKNRLETSDKDNANNNNCHNDQNDLLFTINFKVNIVIVLLFFVALAFRIYELNQPQSIV